MPKRILVVEAAFRFTRPLDGVMVSPSLPLDFLDGYKERPATVTLIFPDATHREVKVNFIQAHYSGRPIELPSWTTECFLEGIESVPKGTEIWTE